ncbi:hypothetical protein TcWFU_005640 [Taenia crassiceps]|uniref:Uncharacterized protein n=1 Tax=Taenia crassiceps TaxID=6207 RepID=A0ABR4QHE4_9CEST
MSPYPKSELFFVRNAFSRRWRTALNDKSPSWYKNGDIESIKHVDSLHQSYPPHIHVRNAEPYPFLEVDAALAPPIHFFMSSSSRSDEASRTDQTLYASELEAFPVNQPDVQGGNEVKCIDRKRCIESSPSPPQPPPPPLPAKLKRVYSKRGMNVSTAADAAGNACCNDESNNANFRSSNGRHLPRSQRLVNQHRRRE